MENAFERWLTLWVTLAMGTGVALGHLFPQQVATLDAWSWQVGEAKVVSWPIALCLFLMMYPIMVKIDFGAALKVRAHMKPVLLTLVLNWIIKPFTMAGIAYVFLGWLFLPFIGIDAVDQVQLPWGWEPSSALGLSSVSGNSSNTPGVWEIPLWKSYWAGTVLLGIAPCTAMVLVWSHLTRGNPGLTLVMVAINSLLMLPLYGPLGGFLLGVGNLPMPWKALLLSMAAYVAFPLVTGFVSRKILLQWKGESWFQDVFLKRLTPITISALLATLVLLFALKAEAMIAAPQAIILIAIPLALQTLLIFALGFFLAKKMRLRYSEAAPAALIGASNHFEVAIATAVMIFGLNSGAALATVVGVLIEVPLMLALVRYCQKRESSFLPNP
jgi:ACR3 family arsenite transporter